MIERLLTPHLVDAIGWTLLHTLWQAAVFALLLGLALIGLRAFSPRARYYVACAFLGAFVLCVGLTFYNLYSVETTGLLGTTSLTQSASSPEVQPDYAAESPNMAAERRNNASPQTGTSAVNDFLYSARTYFDRHLPLIVTLWLMGVLVLQLRLLGQLAWVQRVKSYGTARFPAAWAERIYDLERKLDIRRPVRYLTSSRVSSPFTVGWLRPVVLLPGGMLDSLRESQVMTILAHELAHIKRQDFAVNVLQTFLTTFFFYHPGVWWMSARIQDEREHCCDDLAVTATGERFDYARTLLQLQEQELATPKLAVALGGGGLAGRVTRLLNGYLNTATFGEGVITTLIFAAVLSLAIGTTGQVQASGALAEAERSGKTNSPALGAQTMSEEETEAMNRAIHAAAREAGRQVGQQRLQEPVETDDPFSLLMHAIYDGDQEIAEYLLERVEDLNQADIRGFTPLMAAASGNHVGITRLLISRGADVNYAPRNWNPLIEAADEGSYEVAELLIEAGADVNAGTSDGRSAAIMASSEGFLKLLQLLVEHGADLRSGQIPPLHMAAREGQTTIVRYLLDQGVEVDQPNPDGRTPLSYAVSEGHASVVQVLLEAGADPNSSDEEMDEVTNSLAENALRRLVNSPEILVGPAAEGDLFTLTAMITGLDVNIDMADGRGYTALTAAAQAGHLDIVTYLLERGASVNGSGRSYSPVYLAAREGHPRVVEALARAGADLEAGYSFQTVDRGAQTTFERYGEATPLMMATENNHREVVHLLLSLGADPNATMVRMSFVVPDDIDPSVPMNMDGPTLTDTYWSRFQTYSWTALMQAVENDDEELVRLLLEEGADKDQKTEFGMTALSLAQDLRYDDIARLLE